LPDLGFIAFFTFEVHGFDFFFFMISSIFDTNSITKIMKQDNLKYWRVVRRWVRDRHGIKDRDIDMLLFLYSEKKFTKGRFVEYAQIFSWERGWFKRLMDEGHIIVWRKGTKGKMRRSQIYALSDHTIGIMKSMYRKLDGKESFSEYRGGMFAADPNYMTKVYRNAVRMINKELREKGVS
jgi:hypothetical protein